MSGCPPSTIQLRPSLPAARSSPATVSGVVKYDGAGGVAGRGAFGGRIRSKKSAPNDKCSWNRIAPLPSALGGRSFRMVRMMAPRGTGANLSAEEDWSKAVRILLSGEIAETRPVPTPAPIRRSALRRVTLAGTERGASSTRPPEKELARLATAEGERLSDTERRF